MLNVNVNVTSEMKVVGKKMCQITRQLWWNGEMGQTFAWDETRDRDWFQEGAFWDQRMKALANERKASMLARKEAAKKTQSRRLKQQAKDELVNADQTDRRQKYHPRKWFLKQLEGGETLSFQFIKAGQLGAQTKQTFGRT